MNCDINTKKKINFLFQFYTKWESEIIYFI